jgi:hypothetical protein
MVLGVSEKVRKSGCNSDSLINHGVIVRAGDASTSHAIRAISMAVQLAGHSALVGIIPIGDQHPAHDCPSGWNVIEV